jgi:hypothetical protein
MLRVWNVAVYLTQQTNTATMSEVTKSQIVEDSKFTTKAGQSIAIGSVKKFSNTAEVFINPDGISRHKTVRKVYIIDELLDKMNAGKFLGY